MAGNGTPKRATSGPTSNFDGVLQPTNALIPAEQIVEEARTLALVPLAIVPAFVRSGGPRGMTMVWPNP
jgi:hypothetical protein